MDEIKIKTKFLCGVIAKIFEISIKKNCGVKVKINFNNLTLTNDNGTAVMNVKDLEMEMKSEDLQKMIFGKLEEGDA